MDVTTDGLLWLTAAVFLLVLEMLVPGFVLFFFGLGALVTFVCCWLFQPSLNVQLLIFLIASITSLFSLRGLVKTTFLGGEIDSEADHALTTGGETVLVTKTIAPPMEGKVKYSGTSWRALADERIEEGEVATVVSQDGIIIRVKKMV